MENNPLFSEIRPMYISSADTPNVMNFRLRMKDPIDGKMLQQAVDTTMRRYPYFCVRLTQKGRDRGVSFYEDTALLLLQRVLPGGAEVSGCVAGY